METAKGIAQYKCPSCNGIMEFDPKEGRLKCPFCGTVASPEELEKQEQAADGKPAQPDNAGWGADAQQMQGYRCSSCGAELVADAHTVATRCPYCGNNAVTSDPFHETIRPDYVIPFKLSKNDAVQKYREYQKKKIFLPAAFTRSSYVDEIQGVYVPFWLFSGKAQGEMVFTATDEETTGSGDKKKTVKKSYRVLRAGDMSFSKVPADASKRMPDDLMDSIEPYDYGELKPFDLSCLPGFLAESFDVSSGDSEKRADERMSGTFELKMRESVKHKYVKEEQKQVRILQKKTEYGLLPVWLLSTKWENKTYLFAMNGQSGEMKGDLPVHQGKRWGFTIALFVILMLLFHLPLANWFVDVILAAIITLIVQAVLMSSMRPVAKRTQAGEYASGKLHLTKEEETPIPTPPDHH